MEPTTYVEQDIAHAHMIMRNITEDIRTDSADSAIWWIRRGFRLVRSWGNNHNVPMPTPLMDLSVMCCNGYINWLDSKGGE